MANTKAVEITEVAVAITGAAAITEAVVETGAAADLEHHGNKITKKLLLGTLPSRHTTTPICLLQRGPPHLLTSLQQARKSQQDHNKGFLGHIYAQSSNNLMAPQFHQTMAH